jgi:pyruvate/2-oxoglutarate/acetoin dehydrogenase E1 component
VPSRWSPLPVGKAELLKRGNDLTLVSLGVGVHRALQAGRLLEEQGVSCEVIDLRWVAPLDQEALLDSVARTGRLVVVDEDYECCGLSGEIAAMMLEAGLQPRYARVCTKSTIPYARSLEDETLPSVARIQQAAQRLLGRAA